MLRVRCVAPNNYTARTQPETLVIRVRCFATNMYTARKDGQNYWLLCFGGFKPRVRGGADKSLARSTSRYRRTEWIVSLERGICSCAELQVFYCYRGWKEACQSARAISTISRHELSSSFFFPAGQGTEGNSRHYDRNIRGIWTIVCHRHKLGGPVWTGWFFHL